MELDISEASEYYFIVFYILSILASITTLTTIVLILSTDQAESFEIYHFVFSASIFTLQIVIGLNIKTMHDTFPALDFNKDAACFLYGYINQVIGFFIFYMTFLISNERHNHTFQHHHYHRMERKGAIFGCIGLSFILSISIVIVPFIVDRYIDTDTGLCYSNWKSSRPFAIVVFIIFLLPCIYKNLTTCLQIIYWKLTTHWCDPHITLIYHKKQWHPSVANLEDSLNTFFLFISIEFFIFDGEIILEMAQDLFGNFYHMQEVLLYSKIFSAIPHSILFLYFDRRYMLYFRHTG